ncbi:efflux RND transporter permease subunit [Prosthecobacter sp.]|uniref:efflux RND transporter permease subunit n=1 Tax=Prosthecobacter sp. TaxID=1965333 RepID=UPI003784819A
MDSSSATASGPASAVITRFLVQHRLLGWLAMLSLLACGWLSFQSLPQQEDPTFPTHDAVLITVHPALNAAQMEQQVTAKLEAALTQIPTVEKLQSQSKDNISTITIRLQSARQDVINQQWRQTRQLLQTVKLPEGCLDPRLETDFQLPATMLFAVLGDRAAAGADEIENALRSVPCSGRIRQFGHPPAEIASFEDMMAAGYTVRTLHRPQDGALQPAPAVLVGVEMKAGNIIHDFKQAVLAKISTTSLPEGVQVITVSDQPAATAHRIGEFLRCFIEAVVVVVLVALLLMDWRTALVVAVAIPLTLAMTLAGMAILHVPLQQISIAALIISLGMLVDDPVVAADGINRELAEGQPRGTAAWLGPFKLRRAIFFGTVINIVAFLPLTLLPGDMGAFIITLPIVITLALLSSRIVSMTFIPLLGFYLLRGQKGFDATSGSHPLHRLVPFYKGALQFALHRPLLTIIAAYGLLGASTALIPFFGKQFFPVAERNQFLIDLQLPEGSSVQQTQKITAQIGETLQREQSVQSAVIVSGGGTPMFYYNLLPRQPAANVGQVLVNTRHAGDVPALIVHLREVFDREIKDALCLVKQIEQGPALETPIQIEISGDDIPAKTAQVSHALRSAGAYKVHDDSGILSRINQQRTVTVKALAPFGTLASGILNKARTSFPTAGIAFGGEERELTNSQREMERVLKISLALIALAMMIQFRSIMKSVVVMLTVPLGLIGAFTGMATTHASFGFMALIGIVSLAGVIVSHIIVLSDFIEEERAAGIPLEQALMQAALVRLRAVLATVFATVCGLIPLAVTGGELWRPLTAVHIFGLLFGTVLTLVLLPVLYLQFARWRWIK